MVELWPPARTACCTSRALGPTGACLPHPAHPLTRGQEGSEQMAKLEGLELQRGLGVGQGPLLAEMETRVAQSCNLSKVTINS